jgi:hypothetical protein
VRKVYPVTLLGSIEQTGVARMFYVCGSQFVVLRPHTASFLMGTSKAAEA